MITINVEKMMREKNSVGNVMKKVEGKMYSNGGWNLTEDQVNEQYFNLDNNYCLPADPGVTFEEFKRLHYNDRDNKNRLIAHISNVKTICEKYGNSDRIEQLGYVITFDNKYAYAAGFDGTIANLDRHEKLGDRRAHLTKNSRYRIAIGSVNLSTEYLIGLCRCYLKDKFYTTYKDMEVNIKSGCGNQATRRILGVKHDLRPANLEWVTKNQNITHGKCIMALFKRTGVVYEFTALSTDEYSSPREMLNSFLDDKELKNYCDKTFVKASIDTSIKK